MARALSPPDVGHRVQARPCRFQDDPRLCADRAKRRTPASAPRAHRRRYSRGRAGRVERLEAPAADRTLRRRRRSAAPRPQAERARGADRKQEGGRGRPIRLRCRDIRKAREAAPGKLLDCRAGRGDRGEYAPYPPGGRRAAPYRRGARRRSRGDAGDGARRRPPRPLLSHRRRHPPRRRQHHRRAHPHDARRARARQFPRSGPARPAVRRGGPDRPADARDRGCARQSPETAPQTRSARAAAHAGRGIPHRSQRLRRQ